ncbi:hypothetical protein LY76DRAFT_675418, partial [Colletotrichum caudatum]
MSYRTHRSHARPCSTLLVYIFTSTIADSVRLRTLWLTDQYHVTLPALLTASLGVQLALLFFEARRLPGEYRDDISPQDLCSVFSQRFFFWLNPLIWQGRLRPLLLHDLYPLHRRLKQERLTSILSDALTATQSLDFGIFKNNAESYGAVKLLLSTLGWFYIKPVLPRVLQVVFVVAQPLLLRTLSGFLSKDPSDPSSPSELGLAIIAAYVTTYIGIAVSTGWYWHWVDRSIIATRGLLIEVILDKALLLDVDQASDRGRVVTLVSGDVEKAIAGLESCHELWANALQAGIALWLIYGELGLIFIAPLAVSVAAGAGSMLIAKAARKRQAPVMAAMERRLHETVAMCQSMRSLRMMGLFGVAAERVQGWRQKELDLMRHYRWMTIAAVVTSFIPTTLAPAIVFTALDMTDEAAMGNVSRVFTILSLLVLLCEPLIYLYQLAPYLAFTFVCLGRVGEFLSTPSFRTQPSFLPLDKEKGLEPQIQIRNAKFGWTSDNEPVTVPSFSLYPGQVLVVLGRGGSGKTTLLLGLLGETPVCEADDMLVDRASIALCAQTTWLPEKKAIRAIIVGSYEFDPVWYDSVVNACAPEMAQTSYDTILNTHSLSEGQKRQVSLARAVYSRKSILLLDEPLAGVDESPKSLIQARLLSRDGLLRQSGFIVSEADETIRLGSHQPGDTGPQTPLPSEPGIATVEDSRQFLDKLEIQSQDTLAQHEERAHKEMLKMGEWVLCKYYFRAAGPYWLIPFAFAATGFGIMQRFTDIVVNWWSENESSRPGDVSGSRARMAEYWVLSIAALICLAICTWVLLQRCVPAAGARLHRGLLDALATAPIGILSSQETGTIVNRFVQDFTIIDGELTRHINYTLTSTSEVASSITQLGLVVAANRYFVIVVFLTALALYVIQYFYLCTSRQLRLLELSSRASLISHILATLGGVAQIRNLGYNTRPEAQAVIEDTQRPAYLFLCLKRWLSLVLGLCVAAITTVVVTTAVYMRDRANTGFVAVALINLMGLGSSMQAFVLAWVDLGNAMGSLARIKHGREVLWAPRLTGTASSCQALSPPVKTLAPPAATVEFRQVTASYLLEGPAVLGAFSLVVESGEKIAICGARGSGKTSLLLALMGFLYIKEGSVLAGGRPVEATNHSFCEQIVLIPQEMVCLPSWTIRDYVDPNGRVDDATIISRLRQADLWDGLLDGLGLSADLTLKLSRRQMRRLILVRALLQSVRIVLIDEAGDLME